MPESSITNKADSLTILLACVCVFLLTHACLWEGNLLSDGWSPGGRDQWHLGVHTQPRKTQACRLTTETPHLQHRSPPTALIYRGQRTGSFAEKEQTDDNNCLNRSGKCRQLYRAGKKKWLLQGQLGKGCLWLKALAERVVSPRQIDLSNITNSAAVSKERCCCNHI